MLRFDVYRNGVPAEHVDLSGAYVFGQDRIPVRADLAAAKGQIRCLKRVPGACGLALLWEAGQAGRLMLPTTRLPERKAPYCLNLELARARMMALVQKREEWGLFDYADASELNEEFAEVRGRFLEALKCTDPPEAARLADAALAQGVVLGEKMALFHADVLLERRREGNAAGRMGFGCMVDLLSGAERYRRLVAEAFDVVSVPTTWKKLADKERSYRWEHVDDWVNWAAANRRTIYAGPLVSFDPADVPQWLYIWEHDYEALRETIYDHIHRVVRRYKPKVRLWRVVSGLHAYNSFNLSFEQIMELTRLSCSVVKKLAPRSVVLIELVLPWGEYHARNQRTIPPLLYADMAVQSGIKFDAFGLQIYQGLPQDGMYVRDLMQLSALLDDFVSLGMPLHITGMQVPSDISADAWDAWGGAMRSGDAGHWHVVWNQRLQAEWLQAVSRIALSKPFVETVCWRDLADYEGHYLPHGGLCRNDLTAKTAYKELRALRGALRPREAPKGRSRPEAQG